MRILKNMSTVYDLVADEYQTRASVHFGNTQLWVNRLRPHVTQGASVLDIGCGVGLAVSVLASEGFQPTGIDASDEMVRHARARNPNQKIIHADIFSAQLREKYDVVWAEAFVHLFPSMAADRVFAKLLELLKSNGIVILSTTISAEPSEGWTRKSDYVSAPTRFRRHWTRQELEAMLESNKLQVVDRWDSVDPFGKEWMIYIARYIASN
jgi:2-polyprenyl-3-methyl-5-hydroxy-6-metoxy-1,4-benzoquinol methylase